MTTLCLNLIKHGQWDQLACGHFHHHGGDACCTLVSVGVAVGGNQHWVWPCSVDFRSGVGLSFVGSIRCAQSVEMCAHVMVDVLQEHSVKNYLGDNN